MYQMAESMSTNRLHPGSISAFTCLNWVKTVSSDLPVRTAPPLGCVEKPLGDCKWPTKARGWQLPLQSVSLIIKSMLKDCLGPMESAVVSREFSKAYGLLSPDMLAVVHGPESQLYSVRTESGRKSQQGSCWCHTLGYETQEWWGQQISTPSLLRKAPPGLLWSGCPAL